MEKLRPPGSRAFPQEALDEAAAQFVKCPTCGKELDNDPKAHWDLRVVRARSCDEHGFFFIKWSPVTKSIAVTWVFDTYLPRIDAKP